MSPSRLCAACVALAVLHGGAAFGSTMPATNAFLPDFSAAIFEPLAAITNPYFPVGPGPTKVLVAREFGLTGPVVERSELSYAGPGRVILGVQTHAVLDRAYEEDLLVEETLDYYAEDTEGNVWYMGEDVTNFRYDDEGNLVGTDSESAWIAGVNDALPGWIMPNAGNNVQGFSYYQEFAAEDEALDQAMVLALNETMESGRRVFTGVLANLETTVFEADAREVKYFAPGIGLIRADEGLSPDLTDPELIFQLQPIPLPAGLPLLLAGLGAIALARVVRPRRPRTIMSALS